MKILFFDIETAPMETYNWSLYQELGSTKFVKHDWYILCWCAKWLDNKSVYSCSTQGKGRDDKEVCEKLWELLNEADIVVAHNGAKFDRKKINARFIQNGLNPPSPYKVVDTLTVARSEFAFTSNRLNDLGQYLKVGKKVDTGGFELWLDCMADNPAAWGKMIAYCKQDVKLLEDVYIKLRPYMRNHPNLGTYFDHIKPVCPKCGSEDVIMRGISRSTVKKRRRFSCKCCGGWSTETKDNRLVNA